MAAPAQWLGLARRAGRAAVGRQACRLALRSGRTALVVVAHEVSPAAHRYWARSARQAGAAFAVWGSRELLGRAVGVRLAGVVAVCDREMASNFLAAVNGCTMRAVAGRSGVMSIEEDSGLPAG